MLKKVVLSIVGAGAPTIAAAVSIPTAIVLTNNDKSQIKNKDQLFNNISNQIGSISDSTSIEDYIGSHNPSTGDINSVSGLNQIVNDIKKHLASNIDINSVTTSYLAPIDGKVAINLDLKYTDSNVSNDQQTINSQIKTNIDAIQFQDASFITKIQALDNQNVSNVLNNLKQSIVGMNVGIANEDQLDSADVSANTTRSITPYTLSFAFKSSNSALFYTPTTQSSKTSESNANQTPSYSSDYSVQNVSVLHEITKNESNLNSILTSFNSISSSNASSSQQDNGIYALFDKNTSEFDSNKIIDLLCKNNSGLDRNTIDSVSVSNTTHDSATFNITGMTINVTFKYPYCVNWNASSNNSSVSTVIDQSSGKCVATITLSGLNTGVFDLSNANEFYTFQ